MSCAHVYRFVVFSQLNGTFGERIKQINKWVWHESDGLTLKVEAKADRAKVTKCKLINGFYFTIESLRYNAQAHERNYRRNFFSSKESSNNRRNKEAKSQIFNWSNSTWKCWMDGSEWINDDYLVTRWKLVKVYSVQLKFVCYLISSTASTKFDRI